MQMDTAKIACQRPIVHYSAWEMFGIRQCVPPASETVTVLEKNVTFFAWILKKSYQCVKPLFFQTVLPPSFWGTSAASKLLALAARLTSEYTSLWASWQPVGVKPGCAPTALATPGDCFDARQTSEEPKWCQSRMMPVTEKLIILSRDTFYACTCIA